MKKTNLFYTLVLLNISFACSQIENYPPIEDFDENLFSLEKVVDGIEIPWGLSFTSNNSFLVTDEFIFFTIGDRGNRDINPQNISLDGGKVYRLNKDGSIPDSNPFNNTIDSKKAIWSYGHRNPQGIIRGLNEKEIWIHEHGPRGGDEINIIKDPIEDEDVLMDRNYGWPKATYGINYSGSEITKYQKMDNVIDPFYYWTPSIAPSGMAYVDSDIYPEWKNSILVGSLKFLYLERLEFDENGVTKREKIFPGIGKVRDVNLGPDGYVYISVEAIGVFRVLPK